MEETQYDKYISDQKKLLDELNSNWYDGLLSSDNIHPTDKGAYIIAQNIITDLADIIFGN